MSRDSSGENLESILASIRRSLAEQATSVLDDEIAVPAASHLLADDSADPDVPPLPASLSQHLAGTPDTRQASWKGISTNAGGPSAPDEDPLPAPIVTAVNVAQAVTALASGEAARLEESLDAAAEADQKDPLWFLSQEPELKGAAAAAKTILDRAGAPPPPAMEAKPALDPKPSRLGAVRGPLPPFFGSPAAGVVKVAFVPDPPARQGTEVPPAPPAASVAPPPFDRTTSGEAPRGLDAPQRAADSASSTRASSIFGPAPGGPADLATPQIQALEAMVAELLRPMLRRWLDENMPRLVSAALKAEAELMARRDPARDPVRDPKKP
jgi:cell pole-organizing protein PopZ